MCSVKTLLHLSLTLLKWVRLKAHSVFPQLPLLWMEKNNLLQSQFFRQVKVLKVDVCSEWHSDKPLPKMNCGWMFLGRLDFYQYLKPEASEGRLTQGKLLHQCVVCKCALHHFQADWSKLCSYGQVSGIHVQRKGEAEGRGLLQEFILSCQLLLATPYAEVQQQKRLYCRCKKVGLQQKLLG